MSHTAAYYPASNTEAEQVEDCELSLKLYRERVARLGLRSFAPLESPKCMQCGCSFDRESGYVSRYTEVCGNCLGN